MTPSIIQFLVSAAVIVAAGSALTKFGDIIAEKTGFGRLLVGSILVAGATSLPELAIDINAVRMGAADLAAGDLIGSSLFNLLILAVLDLTRYSHGQMLSKVSAAHALSATTSIALTSIVAVFIFLGPTLQDVTLLRLGPGSYVILAAYLIGIRIVYFGQQQEKAPETSSESGESRRGLKGAAVGYIVAAGAILAAAPVLARAADDLAARSGLGGTFFGTTFVALCTSLPEVVATFSAVRMKAFDLALGNIFGSNCFNMIIFVALDAVENGSLLSSVSPTHVFTALCVIAVTSVVVLGQLFRVEKRQHHLEPDAWLAIVLILASLTGLYFVR